MTNPPQIHTSVEVGDALADGTPVVALESTVYSNLGLPSPDNVTALERCIAAIRDSGAVPAVTAVLDGNLRAGLEENEYERVLGEAIKAAERDLPVAIGQRWLVGATTVSASLAIAELGGISVFATGGVGGVHRGSEVTGDISADLGAIARHRVATVCAGAKSFLDLPKTLETLETLGATVVGWETEILPSFTARLSPYALPYRIDDIGELAAIVSARIALGGGLLIANPVPEADALDQKVHDDALASALADAAVEGIAGAKITPFVLDRIATASGGASVPANISLVENNCRLAAKIAGRLAQG
jgi:pseudouridine-5'-phosphate glycosidase